MDQGPALIAQPNEPIRITQDIAPVGVTQPAPGTYIFDMGQRLSKAIATLDLAVNNHIPARWLEASAVPQATPKAPKPLRYRKKHV